MSELLRIGALPGYEPEIGRWLWAMGAVRRKTIGLVRDMDQAMLDWRGEREQENSIGTLLYHIALVSWLFGDILEEDLPQSILRDFPHPMASGARLSHVPRVSAAEHIARLDRSRRVFVDALGEMPMKEWRRTRRPADRSYEVTPEWVVFHLVEHEPGHAAQIAALKARPDAGSVTAQHGDLRKTRVRLG